MASEKAVQRELYWKRGNEGEKNSVLVSEPSPFCTKPPF